MSLDEVLSKTTQKQYQVWKAWQNEKFQEPSRMDYYLMQIAAELRRGNVAPNHVSSVKTEHFKIKFEVVVNAEEKPFDPIEDSKMMKSLIFPTLFENGKYEIPAI